MTKLVTPACQLTLAKKKSAGIAEQVFFIIKFYLSGGRHVAAVTRNILIPDFNVSAEVQNLKQNKSRR